MVRETVLLGRLDEIKLCAARCTRLKPHRGRHASLEVADVRAAFPARQRLSNYLRSRDSVLLDLLTVIDGLREREGERPPSIGCLEDGHNRQRPPPPRVAPRVEMACVVAVGSVPYHLE